MVHIPLNIETDGENINRKNLIGDLFFSTHDVEIIDKNEFN